jgi:prevent-host-death family protein
VSQESGVRGPKSGVPHTSPPSHLRYTDGMKSIAQRELRNRSGEVLRSVERGEKFTVTVDGRPVAELGPVRRRQWVPRTASPTPSSRRAAARGRA